MPVATVKRTLGRIRRPFQFRSAVGAAPGQIRVDPEAAKPELTVLTYGPDGYDEQRIESVAELDQLDRREVLWVNCDGLGDLGVLTALQERFGLHPLAMEDVVNVSQRPKVESYGDELFIVVRTHGEEQAPSEQVAFYLGERFLLTFREGRRDKSSGAAGEVDGRTVDAFEAVRVRIRHGRGRIRKMNADYLTYALLDAIVDSFFPILERLGDRLETLEAVVFGRVEGSASDLSGRINDLRWSLMGIRRSIWPLRDLLRALQSDDSIRFAGDVQIFLRDCADHVLQALDHVETYQQMAGALMDGFLSLASHRMNEVMKVLTMIATIFIPLSFIAGLYGMNFDTGSPFNMPELSFRFGYLMVWIVMASVAVAMLLFFRRKGWFRD